MPRQLKTRTPFAHRLVGLRSAKGLTQMELAQLTKLSQRVIGLYESRVLQPNMDVVVRLAKALEISADDLLGHKPVPTGKPIPPKVIKRAKLIDELSPGNKKTILDLIDTYHDKKNTQKKGRH